jgi:dihydrofolate synthase/folylpolyglutamate synthase
MSEYQAALDWIYSFAHFETHPSHSAEFEEEHLPRMRVLLDRLGNPQDKFASVHIAGTKGKGSTAAISESILRSAGIRTGLYTSPHLHTFCERIRVAGELVPRQAVIDGVRRLQEIQPSIPGLIVFDLITALAFDYFARAEVEVAVVEVGIGGRLDATNVITPLVSVLASISFDHTAILGDTLERIAREKSGIIKPGVPVVNAPQREQAQQVISEIARQRNARLVQVGRDWQWHLKSRTLEYQEFKVESPGEVLTNLHLNLLGAHQLVNATNAIAAVSLVAETDSRITPAVIRDGISKARWPGRFEIMERAPYLILDGAHNQDSAQVLVSTLQEVFPNTRVQWIYGASNDKDIRGMFTELLQYSRAIILTRSRHPRASDPGSLAILAGEFGVEPRIASSEKAALSLARERMRNGEFDVTVVTGSLFIVGDAREIILHDHGVAVETDS